MKFDALTSIAHNLADSFACGNGFMIGLCVTDVFGEAASSPEGYILVDFIAGTSTGAPASASLTEAISLYAGALGFLCLRHGTTGAAFRELTARYSMDMDGRRCLVTVEDQNGRRSIDEYRGTPCKRPMEYDDLERPRRSRPKRSRTSQDENRPRA
ncbi:hypothetical protein GCM10007301_05030 [Azorhizobium oxalatiphilum]|uniref:Uncharacterized protein n=1 Tax=Azorhizobium oxalatiphilum TaxID=980631 RepID=A0A917BLL9_9HYPH|nr:hypothetical protein [Azorhizobium oxalatiphilum]GGF48763.1 hypothetical protein GCM10007301_05030 [Azorhizobium oxalatiphilum]